MTRAQRLSYPIRAGVYPYRPLCQKTIHATFTLGDINVLIHVDSTFLGGLESTLKHAN